MSRRKARVLAFQALFAYGSVAPPVDELLKFDWEGDKLVSIDESVLSFARNLVAGTIENISLIDEDIKKYLVNWEISRLKRVDLAVLRISVYSLLFQKEIPPGVVIEEAVGICRIYGGESSFRFVNGVLDNIKKDMSDNTPVNSELSNIKQDGN
jgi:N utilization substance protein B